MDTKEDYSTLRSEIVESNEGCTMEDLYDDAYYAGATEQRKIVIDKACEWIMTTPMYAKQPVTLVEEFMYFMEG